MNAYKKYVIIDNLQQFFLSYLPFAAGHFSYQLSVKSYQLSVKSYQLKVIS